MGVFDFLKRKKITIDEFYELGKLYSDKGEYRKSIDYFSKALEIWRKQCQIQLNQDEKYSNLNELKKATSSLADIINQGDKIAFALYGRAIAYFLIKDYRNAILDYTEVLKFCPPQEEKVEIYYERGNIYMEIKDFIAAIKDYSEAIKLDTKNIKAYLGRSQAYLYLSYDFISNVTNEKINKLSKNLGIYSDREMMKIIRDDCNVVLSIENKNNEALFRRGTANMHLGYLDKALTDFEKIDVNTLPEVKNFINEIRQQMTYRQMGYDGNGDKVWI